MGGLAGGAAGYRGAVKIAPRIGIKLPPPPKFNGPIPKDWFASRLPLKDQVTPGGQQPGGGQQGSPVTNQGTQNPCQGKGQDTVPQQTEPQGRSFKDILENKEIFEQWLKGSHEPNKPLSNENAKLVWDKLIEKGFKPRTDPGHLDRPFWKGPHIVVEGKPWHIPIQKDFKP